ncbi:MAG: lasso peptide biosynthesis B2 protein [Woeseia sp.]
MIDSAYKLANNAYICLVDDRLVFSDIRHDRYCCLDRRDTQTALQLFHSFPGSDIPRSSESSLTSSKQTKLIIRALNQAGLLADGKTGGKALAPVRVPPPMENLDTSRITASPRPGHWASFLQATISASAKLRFQSLQRILRGVERRKRRHSQAQERDRETMLSLAAIFHQLRLYYVREYLCRFDSLALIEFLAYYRHFPDWVFGVTGEPFTAHCWVQDGKYVLNDSVDFVRRFTPIMAF